MDKVMQAQELTDHIEETLNELEVIRAMNECNFQKYLKKLQGEMGKKAFKKHRRSLEAIRNMDDEDFIDYMSYCCEPAEELLENPAEVITKLPDEKQNGTIIAFQRGHKLDGIKAIAEKYPWIDIDWLLTKKRFYCVDKPVAKVICHPDDVFNQEIGEELAVKRLEKIINGNRKGAVKNFDRYIKNQLL